MRIIPFLLPVALASTACSTSYAPQNSGRVSVVVRGGRLALNTNGRDFRTGPFGGDVDQAVACDARAKSEAETYQTQQTTGTIFVFAGGALVGVGAGLFAASVLSGSLGESGSSTSSVGGALGPSLEFALGGLVAAAIGRMFTSSAETHLWDAVNIYNDGIANQGCGQTRSP
jgi:hypothetical protein